MIEADACGELSTQDILLKMLRQPVDRHPLDSGRHYGYLYERNQGRDVVRAPAATLTWVFGGPSVTLETYHFLASRLTYNAEADEAFQTWARAQQAPAWHHPWLTLELQSTYKAHLLATGEEIGGVYGEGEPFIVHTYNTENLLNQQMQYLYFTDPDGPHVLLSVHGGCDIRSGYSDSHLFDCTDGDGIALWESAHAAIACDGDCGTQWMTEDAGGHWSTLNANSLEALPLNAYDVLYEAQLPEFFDDTRTILITRDDEAYCPVCGCGVLAVR